MARPNTLRAILAISLIFATLSATARNSFSQTTSKGRIEESTLDGSAMKVMFLSKSPWDTCASVRASISAPISRGWQGHAFVGISGDFVKPEWLKDIPLNAARFCSFPDLKPCPDKDGDGVPACVSAAPDAPVSYGWQEKVVMQNGEWLAGSVKKPPIVAIMDSCATGTSSAGALSVMYKSWRDMSVPVADCPLVRFFTDNLKRTYPDCDDTNRNITLAQWGPGAIPSFSITGIDLTEANKQNHPTPNAPRPFTLLDQISVTITPKRPSECQRQEQRVSILLVINGKRFLLADSVGLGDKPTEYEVDLTKLRYDYSENDQSLDPFEDAIEQIRKGGTAFIRVENEEFGDKVYAHIPFPLSNCFLIEGKGEKSIAFMRTRSLVSSIERKKYSTEVARNFSRLVIRDAAGQLLSDLLGYAPFNQHDGKYSVWIDLALHEDRDWSEESKNIGNSSNGLYLSSSDFLRPKQVTSCRNAETVFAFARQEIMSNPAAIAFPMSSTVWVDPFVEVDRLQGSSEEYVSSWATRQQGTYLHEYAHIVGGLNDEYGKTITWAWLVSGLAGEELSGDMIQDMSSRNCVLKPDIQFRSSLNGKRYGATAYGECGMKGLFRPSNHSHMNDLREGFNVISCSFIQQGILRTPSNQPHLAECAAMPGINTEGMER